MSAPYVLVPTALASAMLTSSTAAEPSASETAWNSATSYVVGQECILSATHRVYTCLIAGVNATSPDQALTGSSPRWKDTRATNAWAMFDPRSNWQTAVVTPLTVVVRPGLFNAIAFYGLDGVTISISIKDAPAGSVFYTYSSDLAELPIDHYDYYFGPYKMIRKVLCSAILPYVDPEVTISITAAAGITVKCGMVAFGDLRQLVTTDGTGGTQYGASAIPITNSYIATDQVTGLASVQRRTTGTDIDIQVVVPPSDSDSILSTMQDCLGVPCAWIGSDLTNYTGLNTFGLGSGRVTYSGPGYSTISISVKGLM